MATHNTNAIRMDGHNPVTAKQLYKIIDKYFNRLQGHPEIAKILKPTMVWGPPGVGKSTIIQNYCKEKGIGFIDFRLAQREPVDVHGLPVPDLAHNSVKWLLSDEFPRDPDSKGIILFDELTAADRSNQVAAYQLILDRCSGKDYQIPPGWYIMAAGNRAEDRAVSVTLSSALATRFQHVTLEADAESWLKWGAVNDINPAVMGFIRMKPDQLFDMDDQNLQMGWPCPRSWEGVSEMLKTFDNIHDRESEDYEIIQKLVEGLVGPGASTQFMAFYGSSMNFEDVLKMMTDPNTPVKIPAKADMVYALVSTMTYFLWKGKDAKDVEARIAGFYRIVMKLSADFATMAMQSAVDGASSQPGLITKLVARPEFQVWQKEFGKNIEFSL